MILLPPTTTSSRYFPPEILPKLEHTHKGRDNEGGGGSQLFTLGENIDRLPADGKHAVFEQVAEGLDTLDKLNEVFVNQDG